METPVKIGFAVAVLVAFGVSVKVLRDRLPEGQGTVKVVARLDEHTIAAGPEVANTIPTFLELPGEVGILADSPAAAAAPASAPGAPATATEAPAAAAASPTSPPAAPASTPAEGGSAPPAEAAPPPVAESAADQPILPDAVQPILETELQKGYCSASVTKLIRQRYPGTYDSIPDADLEKGVLKQRPEYKGRICVFPAWITASPHTIVKYEIERSVIVVPPSIWIWSGGIAAAFGFALFMAYKQLVEKAAAKKPVRSSSRPHGRAQSDPRKAR